MWKKKYISFLTLLMLIIASDVYADGCFVWRKGADLYEPSQKAIIYWKDGKETLVLQVRYEGSAEDFAWIVPLPSKPEVAAIDSDMNPFAEVSLYTQLRRRWGYRGRFKEGDVQGKVTVLERKVVGVYDIAILSASDAAALNKWLDKNGYAFPTKRTDVLEHYTKKKWVYVAMRIDRKALESDEIKKLKTGELQPIRFSFTTEKMVYPLKISSVNTGETELLLYLLADTPMVVEGSHNPKYFSIDENIPRSLRYQDLEYGTYRKAVGYELPLTWEAIGLSKDKELSLCKYRSVYKVEEMTDDLVFARFDPISYCKEKLSKAEANTYEPEWASLRSLSVLACYDPNLLLKLARGKKEMRELAALNPKAPEHLLRELAEDNHYSVRVNVARNLSTSEKLLRQLAKSKNIHVRGEVALNPNVPADVFKTLVQDEEHPIGNALAKKHTWHGRPIRLDVLEELSKDIEGKDEHVRDYVGRKIPNVHILRKLSKDRIARIRMSVASNNNTPKELLEQLAGDEDMYVRRAVANNMNVSDEILHKLAGDKYGDVRRSVVNNYKTSAELLIELSGDRDPYVRKKVASNTKTPSDILSELANDTSADVRRVVAFNPRTHPEILTRLADDETVEVRRYVSVNPRTPTKTLLKLELDKEPWVVRNLAWNPNTPAELLRRLAKNDRSETRAGLAKNPNTPVDLLRKLANDSKNTRIREYVAYNPSTPEETLRKLAKDEHEPVSKAARYMLKYRRSKLNRAN